MWTPNDLKKKKRVPWRTQGQRGKKERYGCLCFSLSFCVGARRVESEIDRAQESRTVDSRLINPDGTKDTNDNGDDDDDDEGAQPALPEAGRHPPEQQAVDEEGQLRVQAVRGGHLAAVLRMEDDDRECSQSARGSSEDEGEQRRGRREGDRLPPARHGCRAACPRIRDDREKKYGDEEGLNIVRSIDSQVRDV